MFLKSYKPEETFVGISPKIKMTEFSGGFGKKFNGNSILLSLGKNKYVFIGQKIIEFTTKKDKIIDFVSPVGNNDVPYPFAIGEKYVYSFSYPNGYFLKKDLDFNFDNFKNSNIDNLFDKLFMYGPFAKPLKNKSLDKSSDINMTIKEFKKIMELHVDDISFSTLKNICGVFRVAKSGTKSELIYRLEKLRGLKFKK